MRDNEKSKQHIIEAISELLKEYGNDPQKITSRLIAERAGIGLGTINYFFGSKENLIKECIQKNISKILFDFTPEITDFTKEDGCSDKIRLISWASQTFDFLFEHQAIANVSILSDLQHYLTDSNSVYTQKGFAFAIRNRQYDEAKRLLVFLLVSVMQVAFLAKDVAKEVVGFDLYSKNERNAFICNTVTMLFEGIEHLEDINHER